jgi:hypothetical protein
MKKSLTARDFLKFKSSDLLAAGTGKVPALSADERWQQAVFAKTVRNFWFTATGEPSPTSGGLAPVSYITAETQRFAEPIIVTDLLSMFDYKLTDPLSSAMVSRYLLQITRYGSHDASTGIDLFGLTGLVGAEFITKHEKNRSTTVQSAVPPGTGVFDTQPKYLPFVPRLLEPYDFLQARWEMNPLITGQNTSFEGWYPQLGLRAVRVFAVDNPYRYIQKNPAKRIKDYVAQNEPETFFLTITFPFSKIPALNAPPLDVRTPEMGRPLLVLGAATNLEGVQSALYEDASYYNFTSLDPRPKAVSKVPAYTYVPMSLWAANTDFRNTNMFNMWPVPHLLEPGAQLSLKIVNGLATFFDAAGGFFQNIASTRNSQDVRITFICRTV